MTTLKPKDRPKCAGWTKGDYRGNYPCALYALPGSDYCRYHDPKMLEAKEEARLAALRAQGEPLPREKAQR